jgi:GrpB-like predicted nucleotidyltransferase (UPF0157 family)
MSSTLTQEQQQWIAHLDDSNAVRIFPYDPTSAEKFQTIRELIQNTLGEHVDVVHRGASSLGISGQGELDIYVPSNTSEFESRLELLINIFGKPGSVYPSERARFVSYIDKTKAEIFLMNTASQGWLDGLMFEQYLRENPESLDEYRQLKESGDGLSTRKYYRRKLEFINSILARINHFNETVLKK